MKELRYTTAQLKKATQGNKSASIAAHNLWVNTGKKTAKPISKQAMQQQLKRHGLAFTKLLLLDDDKQTC